MCVIEGEAPALKQQEMSRRLQTRNKGMTSNSKATFGRGHFNALLKEVQWWLPIGKLPVLKHDGFEPCLVTLPCVPPVELLLYDRSRDCGTGDLPF